MMTKTITAVFEDGETARTVVDEVVQLGVARKSISVATQDRIAAREFEDKETAGNMAVTGIFGAAVALGILCLPGVGPILVMGPLAAAAAGVGALDKSLGPDSLSDLGVPMAEATLMLEAVRRGHALVVVDAPEDMVKPVAKVLARGGAIAHHARAEAWANPDEDAPMPAPERERVAFHHA
jgi:hypothetical protein